MDHHAIKSLIRQGVALAPLVVPALMVFVTHRAFAHARKIKDLAINEVIPFSDFAAAELRARRLAFATVIFAILGTIGIASLLAPPPPIRPKTGTTNHDDMGDIDPNPVMTSRDPVPSRPNSSAATADDEK